MRKIDVEKKQRSRWPWLLGLAVLVLVLWGVTILLRPPAPPEAPAVGTTAADTLPPAVIPTDPDRAPRGTPRAGSGDGALLIEDNLGETVRVEGEVVATGNEAFWILVDSRVVRVDSPRHARRGDTLAVRGTLREADAAVTDRLASEVMSRHPDFETWTVVRMIKLVEEPMAASAAMGVTG